MEALHEVVEAEGCEVDAEMEAGPVSRPWLRPRVKTREADEGLREGEGLLLLCRGRYFAMK